MRLRNLYILIQLFIWAIIFLIISPWPIGLVVIEIADLDISQLFVFLLYEILIKALLVYTYAHIALPVYFKGRKIDYLIFINLAFWILFSVFESIVNELYIQSVHGFVAGLSWENVTAQVPTHLFINLFLLTYANLTGFAYAWFRDEQQRRILEREKLQAELSALKHQIHPHFLFNTLNGLYGLAYQNDDEDTAEGIAKLSHLMRYMIYEAKDEFVPLVKEISYIQNYIDLQRLRISKQNQIHFCVKGTPGNKKIAPLLFIPFIENVFKHGISTVNPFEVTITLDITATQITFKTVNAISPNRSHSEKSYGGIGLTNVKKRLELLYPRAYSLTVEESGKMYRTQLTLYL